jgi:MoaA/NifB/PqqE/SkfB family radical SAM enzyme
LRTAEAGVRARAGSSLYRIDHEAHSVNPVAAAPEALPRFLQIEPVGQCNLRCRMCPIQFRTDGSPGAAPAFLELDTFCRLLDQFPDLAELHLQGLGEPLMHPAFFAMVRHAVARGITVSTNSNLTVLSERRAAECVASGLSRIHVSIDGADASTYEYIRVRSRYERVLRNVRRLVAARSAADASTPEIRLVAVVMRTNLHQLADLVRLAYDLQTPHLSVQHLCHDYGEQSLPEKYRPMRAFVEAETLLGADPEAVRAAFERARAAARALGVTLRLPNMQPRPFAAGTDGRSRCDWPWRGAYLSYSGEAMPCCMVSTPDRISLGNMAREGVAAVWQGKAYETFRRDLADGPPPEVCRSCSLYHGTF